MHTRTEDLLKIRDGEPIDAALRERLLADPECVRELERLRRVKQALGELETLEPPPHVWAHVKQELETSSRAPRMSSWHWALGSAIAASVAAAALVMLSGGPDTRDSAGELPSTIVADSPAQALPAWPQVPVAYASLVAESARLERMLADMPRQRRVMSADMASTIAALEDRVAWIDGQLSVAAALDVEPPRRQALWSERVDLMNALVHVRYAQEAGY